MKAVAIDRFGPADLLTLRDLPEPDPAKLAPHDMIVEVHAVGLNPVDTKVRQGYLGDRAFPLVLGFDCSGVVKAIGSAVTNVAPGDAVYVSPNLARPGANAELVVVDARSAATKPTTLDHVHAAALPLVTLTAWESLHDRARLHPGETVLIHAGAGGVGHIAIQLAKQHDCRVFTTAGRPESIEFCRSLGADVVIDYTREDFVQRVMRETDNRGCDVVLESISGPNFNKSIDCVAINGRLVTILAAPDDAQVNKLFRKNASLHFEFMGVPTIYNIKPDRQAEVLKTVAELVDAGKLTPHVSRVFKLEELAEAHKLQESGRVIGKIVLTVR